MADYEVLVDAKAELGEGPVWDAKKGILYWLDILAGRIHVYDPATGKDKVIQSPKMVGCMALRKSGGLIAARADGIYFFDADQNKWQFITDPEKDKPDNRFNDGKADPAGRFWAGTISLKGEAKVAALYCLEKDLSVRKVVDSVTNSNGLAWDVAARKMYYIDTPTMEVAAFDYDVATGKILNRKPCIKIPEGTGYPDGMCIDAEGMLWVCLWDGYAVVRWDPKSGKVLKTIELPAPNVSCCVFGGKNLDELYVTSARLALDEPTLKKYPLSGALFRVKPGVKGVPTDMFAG